MEKYLKPCEASVSDGWHSYPCSNNAKVEVDGKHYCGVHNPKRLEEIRKKNQIRYDKEAKEREYKVYAIKYCEKKGITLEELKKEIEA